MHLGPVLVNTGCEQCASIIVSTGPMPHMLRIFNLEAFAMTINKAQGQLLQAIVDKIGKSNIMSHMVSCMWPAHASENLLIYSYTHQTEKQKILRIQKRFNEHIIKTKRWIVSGFWSKLTKIQKNDSIIGSDQWKYLYSK